jgi:hypothetical protein
MRLEQFATYLGPGSVLEVVLVVSCSRSRFISSRSDKMRRLSSRTEASLKPHYANPSVSEEVRAPDIHHKQRYISYRWHGVINRLGTKFFNIRKARLNQSRANTRMKLYALPSASPSPRLTTTLIIILPSSSLLLHAYVRAS